ncbi:type II secretion system protein [Candidatus Saccharibacteria bacterium]|nr:type II secretion system protein [Candidatus Saccharibacteria bacterium]NCS83109.1 type II secretion system protein [Candidatus Saccharibacteria bacterium]
MKKRHLSYHSAFTIVELLAAVVVIGILATVSVVGYGAWQNNIAETQLKSDINGVRAAMDNAKNWGENYPQFASGTEFDGTNATSDIFVQSDNSSITYYQAGVGSYCLDAVSVTRTGVYFFYDASATGPEVKHGTCAGGEEVN